MSSPYKLCISFLFSRALIFVLLAELINQQMTQHELILQTLKMLPPALYVVLTPILRTSCPCWIFFWQTENFTSDFFTLFTTCMFLQSIYYPKNALCDTTRNIFNCYVSQQWDAILRKLLHQRCTRSILVGQFAHLCCKNSMRMAPQCWNM